MKIDIECLGNIKTLWERKKQTLEFLAKKYENFDGKLWVIGDLHLPYSYVPALKQTIQNLEASKRKGIRNLIIASGDWITFDTFSSFLQLGKTHRLSEEIERLKYALKIFRNYGEIIYLKANHELRLEKWLLRNTDGKAEDLRDIGASLEKLLSDTDITLIDNWFCKIGDVIICHPESGSMVRGRVGDWSAERFYNSVKNWRVLFVAHTHRQNILWHKGRLVVECGALCRTQDYAVNGKVAMWRTEGQYYGYGEAMMKRGVADINSCRFVNCGSEPPLL